LLTVSSTIDILFLLVAVSGKMKEPFDRVEQKKSAVALPTKRIERNPVFEVELCKQ
jgi:hypothetical protein